MHSLGGLVPGMHEELRTKGMSVQFVPGSKHFEGMRVTILGMARQGMALARYFLPGCARGR